jgi:NAD(P)-dependent dehydrogenase (short-subunit alcohol dehydrogenase family)
MNGSLKGKTILVTGAGSGIGKASAVVFAAAGANVVVTDVNEVGGQTTAQDIVSMGAKGRFLKADMSIEGDIKNMVETTVAEFGRLDGAFNNAGIVQRGKKLHELSNQEWDDAIRIDQTAVFWCIKYEVMAMLKSGGGSIVNTASSLGQVAIANAAEYISAKHGVMGLTRAAAADYGSSGIRVNAILPGIIRTPVIATLSENPQFAAFLEKLKDRHPIGRFGEPEEIGKAATFLLSDAASFVNGAAFAVDGGYLAI